MKKYIYVLAFAMFAMVGCKDNSGLYGLLNDYDARISELEQLCAQMNTNIVSLQQIVSSSQAGDYITNVSPITQSGATIGYTITFAKSGAITIYNGKDGVDGTNGTNGANGHSPVVGVKQDTDGVYYWTLDGAWLTDEDNNKVRVTGRDGANGTNGQDGQNGQNGTNGTNGSDGITPQLKIENDYWYISYNNGSTWTQLGKATGADGAKGDKGDTGEKGDKGDTGEKGDKGDKGDTGATGPAGQNGTNGTNGTNGQDGDSMFQSVTQDENNVYFTLADGTVITIAKNTGSGTHNPADIIEFKDLFVESALLKLSIDTNGDGKISYGEAAAMTGRLSLSGNTQIMSFKELEYFTGLSSVSFNGCTSLFEIVLPNTLDTICNYAFSCGTSTTLIVPLHHINIPTNCKYIGEYAFYGNQFITNLTIPSSCTTIGLAAFCGCKNLQDVTIEEGCKTIGLSAFSNCSIESLSLPSTIETMGNGAFSGNNLTEFTFPLNLKNGFQVLGDRAHVSNIVWNSINCASQINRGSSVSQRLNGVGYGEINSSSPYYRGIDTEFNGYWACHYITNIQIGNQVQVLPAYIFCGCSIESIDIPNNVIRIEEGAFAGCALTTITIGENVAEIGNGAFYKYSAINPTVYCKNTTPPIIGNEVFYNVNIIYVPRASVNDYRTAWSTYASRIMAYDF